MKLKKLWKDSNVFMTNDNEFFNLQRVGNRYVVQKHGPAAENEFLEYYWMQERKKSSREVIYTYFLFRKNSDATKTLVYENSCSEWLSFELLGEDLLLTDCYEKGEHIFYDFFSAKVISSVSGKELKHSFPVGNKIYSANCNFERGVLCLRYSNQDHYYRNIDGVFQEVSEDALDEEQIPPFGWQFVSDFGLELAQELKEASNQ